MSQVPKNYFTTGEFAKICGVNKKHFSIMMI